jgi:hypothetical protein
MFGRTGEGVPLGPDEAEGVVVLAVLVLLEDDPFAPEDLKNERGGIFLYFSLFSELVVRRCVSVIENLSLKRLAPSRS